MRPRSRCLRRRWADAAPSRLLVTRAGDGPADHKVLGWHVVSDIGRRMERYLRHASSCYRSAQIRVVRAQVRAFRTHGLSEAVAAPSATPSSSSLSQDVVPFYLGCCSGGRTKHHRWADGDGDESDDDHPSTYLEATRRSRSSYPLLASRLVQSWFWDKAERRLDDRDPREGRGSAAISVPTWCCPLMPRPLRTGLLPQCPCVEGDPPSKGDAACYRTTGALSWPKATIAHPKDPHRAS